MKSWEMILLSGKTSSTKSDKIGKLSTIARLKDTLDLLLSTTDLCSTESILSMTPGITKLSATLDPNLETLSKHSMQIAKIPEPSWKKLTSKIYLPILLI